MAYNLISEVLPIQYKHKPPTKPIPEPPRQPVARPSPAPPTPAPAPALPVYNDTPLSLSLSTKLENLTGRPVPNLIGKAEQMMLDRIKVSSGEEFTNPFHGRNKVITIVFVFVLALALHLFIKKSIKHLVKHNDVNELFIIFMYAIIATIILWLITSHKKAPA